MNPMNLHSLMSLLSLKVRIILIAYNNDNNDKTKLDHLMNISFFDLFCWIARIKKEIK